MLRQLFIALAGADDPMRITVPAIIIVAICLYRLSIISHGGKEPAIVSVLLMAALWYKFCANGCEREKRKLVDAQAQSTDDYSVEEWIRIRRLGPSSEPPAAKNGPTPITHASAGPMSSPMATWGQLARRLITATVIMCCYLLLALFVSGVFLPYYRLQTGYEATQATVIEKAVAHQVVHGNDWYSPRLRLRYQAGGVTREQWCGIDTSHFYRSIEHPTTQRGLYWFADRTRAEENLSYPVGGVVRTWYRPDQPELVVVPNSGVLFGAVAFCVISFSIFTVPVIRLVRKAWNHRFVLRHTTGRVLRGEVCSNSAKASRRHYSAVLYVQPTGRESATLLEIEWGKFSEKSAAAAELGQMLAAHPTDQTTPIWFDPAGRYPPTFESFGFFKALVGAAALVVWAPATLVTFPFQVTAKIARTIFPR